MASTEPADMQLREIVEADQEFSFDMINLIKYRPTAIYESAADNAIGRSGREAYQEYGMVAFPKIIGMGGSLVYKGTCEHQLALALIAMTQTCLGARGRLAIIYGFFK